MNPIFLRFWSNLVLNSCNCLDLFTVHLPSMALLFISSFVHSILFSCHITCTSHVFPNPDFFIKMKTDKIINDFICFRSKETKKPCWTVVKVNLFQKHLFLHQLTQNMTNICSVHENYRTCCVHKLFFVFVLTIRTNYVHNMFWACRIHVQNW